MKSNATKSPEGTWQEWMRKPGELCGDEEFIKFISIYVGRWGLSIYVCTHIPTSLWVESFVCFSEGPRNRFASHPNQQSKYNQTFNYVMLDRCFVPFEFRGLELCFSIAQDD